MEVRSTSPDGNGGESPSSDSREQLQELVADDPGQSLLEAARKLDLHVSTVSYHARRLEDADKLRLLRDGRSVRLFPAGNGLSGREIKVIAALQSPRARDVMEFLAESPGATKTEAARDLGLSVKGVGWHVDRLEELDLVRVDGDSRGYSIKLRDEVEPLVDRLEELSNGT